MGKSNPKSPYGLNTSATFMTIYKLMEPLGMIQLQNAKKKLIELNLGSPYGHHPSTTSQGVLECSIYFWPNSSQ